MYIVQLAMLSDEEFFFGVKIANKLLTHLPNNVFKGKETLQPKIVPKETRIQLQSIEGKAKHNKVQ